MLELLKKIVDESKEELCNAFMSVTTDFWTDSHRREQFGALVDDIIAAKYEFADGMTLFMSWKTAKSLDEDVLSTENFSFLFMCVFLI